MATACRMVGRWSPLLLAGLAPAAILAEVACPAGEPVKAYMASATVAKASDAGAKDDYGGGKKDEYGGDDYGGDAYSYDYYEAGEACTPEHEECYFAAAVNSGPNAQGYYLVDWDDGSTKSRRVPSTQVKQASSGQICQAKKGGGKAAPAGKKDSKKASPPPPPPADIDEDENWTPPEIPCTVMPRLHWEGSDPEWNKEAIDSLRKKFKPDELIDGFDWHVILRFNDADRCEKAYKSLEAVLNKCTESDPEQCRTHKYVKAIEYVGDDPETRRKTGRKVHKADPNQKRAEL